MSKKYSKNGPEKYLVEETSSRYHELEERTAVFSESILAFLKPLKRYTENQMMIDQLARSSTSVGANYLEANNSLGRKDLAMKIKFCRKEARESEYWLRLIDACGNDTEKAALQKEAHELTCIFGSILAKVIVK